MAEKRLQYDDLTEDEARDFECIDCVQLQYCHIKHDKICDEFETWVKVDDNG